MYERVYYLYILTNKIKTVLYIGVTNNLESRLWQHKIKINKGFTSKYNVDKLIYYEEFQYINDAIEREKQLKNWSRQWKVSLINEFNPKWENLDPNCHAELDSASRLRAGATNKDVNEIPDQVRDDRGVRDDKKIREISPLQSPKATFGRDGSKKNNRKKRRLGKLGETMAANYLQTKGYRVKQTNYYTAEGEIDIVCQKDKSFIFVEVKTRTNHSFGWPEDSVSDAKLEKIILAAEKYIQKNDITNFWQIDIISIVVDRKSRLVQISHFKNIIQS
ncbi:MAG: hypothetical protein CMI53_02555 [Parcubacteria group bacterium]|jgi:putative endonuclease|nr:hypothetical protein [Parcubacteria group bacterium]|tara:strand:- start:2100 stop:2927 length:828 start_codon:yes stop_codon:yes gene_type:complete